MLDQRMFATDISDAYAACRNGVSSFEDAVTKAWVASMPHSHHQALKHVLDYSTRDCQEGYGGFCWYAARCFEEALNKQGYKIVPILKPASEAPTPPYRGKEG